MCLDYPSRSLPLQGLAEGLVQEVRDAAGPQGRVFAVTHSMGAVVLRHIMGLENSGGIMWMGAILLAPPNQGSTVARILSQVRKSPAPTTAGYSLAAGWPATGPCPANELILSLAVCHGSMGSCSGAAMPALILRSQSACSMPG